MKNLDKIFSEEDITLLIEYADGRKHDNFEYEIETFDHENIGRTMLHMKNGLCEQRLIARFHYPKNEGSDDGYGYPEMMLVIGNDGDVSFQNLGNCRFRLHEPLKAYELMLRRLRPELFE
jgi:hypothetical protein